MTQDNFCCKLGTDAVLTGKWDTCYPFKYRALPRRLGTADDKLRQRDVVAHSYGSDFVDLVQSLLDCGGLECVLEPRIWAIACFISQFNVLGHLDGALGQETDGVVMD